MSPEIFTIGSFGPRWYGLMFATGFYISLKIIESFARDEGEDIEKVSDLLFWTILATIIGARLGHVFFYQPGYYLSHPLEILMIWKGGLASHGGFIGVIISWFYFAKTQGMKWSFWEICDRTAIPAAMTAGLIRIGNFFNSEIVGHPTDVSWAVIFKKVDSIPRHPTQIYESLSYLTVFIISYIVFKKTKIREIPGRMMGFVIILGFSARFIMEFWKENQVHFENQMLLNMGQLLSIPFVLIGFFLLLGLHSKFQKTR